jgi:hypothetical protein
VTERGEEKIEQGCNEQLHRALLNRVRYFKTLTVLITTCSCGTSWNPR